MAITSTSNLKPYNESQELKYPIIMVNRRKQENPLIVLFTAHKCGIELQSSYNSTIGTYSCAWVSAEDKTEWRPLRADENVTLYGQG